MRPKTQWMIAIAILGVATTGALTVPYLAARSDSAPMRPGLLAQRMPWQHGPMMQHMQAANEFEYLSLMIPHHEEAIATAQRVLKSSNRPEMQALARNIIEVQSAEIQQMKGWLNDWYPGRESSVTYIPMMRDLSQLEAEELDQAFLQDMIMHHMEAVMMSQMLMNHGLVEHAAVQPFAQNIANTQRQEMFQMRTWLQDWYGVAGMPMPGPMHRGGGRPMPGGRHQGW